ncbi:HDOD domain-containing protein [Lacunimicrobium album]
MMNWSELRAKLLGAQGAFVLPPAVKLPMMPSAVIEFTKHADDPAATPKKLAEIIETDAGLSCELLKHVNSAAMGLRHTVSTVKQAISILGIRTVKLMLLTSSAKNMISNRQSKLIHLPTFWVENLEKALFAKEIARLLKADEEVAFSSAMLSDLLLPILTNEAYEPYFQFVKNQDAEPKSICTFERNLFKWDHACAGAHVLHGWYFPDDVVCAVYLHHDVEKLLESAELKSTAVAAVACASLLPDAMKQRPDGLEKLIALADRIPGFDLLQVATSVQEKFQTMCPAMTNHFPLVKRVEKHLFLTTTDET